MIVLLLVGIFAYDCCLIRLCWCLSVVLTLAIVCRCFVLAGCFGFDC